MKPCGFVISKTGREKAGMRQRRDYYLRCAAQDLSENGDENDRKIVGEIANSATGLRRKKCSAKDKIPEKMMVNSCRNHYRQSFPRYGTNGTVMDSFPLGMERTGNWNTFHHWSDG
jgi:hypothetical protein